MKRPKQSALLPPYSREAQVTPLTGLPKCMAEIPQHLGCSPATHLIWLLGELREGHYSAQLSRKQSREGVEGGTGAHSYS